MLVQIEQFARAGASRGCNRARENQRGPTQQILTLEYTGTNRDEVARCSRSRIHRRGPCAPGTISSSHTHTHIYIYIYIYLDRCSFVYCYYLLLHVCALMIESRLDALGMLTDKCHNHTLYVFLGCDSVSLFVRCHRFHCGRGMHAHR